MPAVCLILPSFILLSGASSLFHFFLPSGKSRPQRPPVPQKKPAKPPKPTSKPVKAEGNESVTKEESKDTERQPNHSNSQSESSNGPPPRASRKPKVPPAKPSGNASDTNNGTPEVVNSSKPEGGEDRIDGDLSQGAQTENQNKERAKIQTSSSTKLPPRSKHPPKTELTKDNNSLKKVNSLSNSSEPSSATVSRSSSSCSSSGEKPFTLPKPPRKKVQVKENELANNTSEIQNGEPLVIATTSPSEEQCLSSDQAVPGGSSPGQSSKIAKEEESKENQNEDQNLLGSNIVNDKKVALKPKPSRPPPPLKRPSQLKKSKSEDIPNKEDQVPKVKPKPSIIKPKSVKSPKLTEGGGHSAIKEDVLTKQKDSNLEQSQPVGGGKEEKIKVGGVKNSGHSNTASQPLPPPRKKRLSMIGMESQDIASLDEQAKEVATDEIDETEKGTPKHPDPGPGISRSAKRASNGTMFAVIGESRSQNVVEADGSDKTLNVSPSNESKQDSVASKGDIKPRRVAPAKPPPPSPQALLKQKSMKESPNTPSPPHTPSKRPNMRPPPVPLAKPKDVPKKDSNKTRPKRPSGPPVARRAAKEEVSKVKETEEDKQENDSGAVGEVEGDDTKELSSPPPREDGQDADVFGQELSSNSAEDVVSGESKEEPSR